MTITVSVAGIAHEVEGTVFADGRPRILAIDGYRMELIPERTIVLIVNDDRPGVIGLVGQAFGSAGINIADMALSRRGKTALMVLKLDALSAFLGLGYVIGLRYNAVIVAGGLLSHFAFIPAIWFLGQHVPERTRIVAEESLAFAPKAIALSRWPAAAQKLGMSTVRLNELVRGKRGVTADTAIRLAQLFKTTPQFWMHLQVNCDLWHGRRARSRSALRTNSPRGSAVVPA